MVNKQIKDILKKHQILKQLKALRKTLNKSLQIKQILKWLLKEKLINTVLIAMISQLQNQEISHL